MEGFKLMTSIPAPDCATAGESSEAHGSRRFYLRYYVERKTMGDFFTGMTYGDQLEMGMAVVGGGMDNETLNAMIRQEMDERALATQVQKHGPGHGRDAVSHQ